MQNGCCRKALAFVVALELLFVAGCGPAAKPSGTLHGKVTFEGKPVEKARIEIRAPKTGEAFAAVIGSGGTYMIDRVTTGEYLAVITPVVDVPVAGASKEPPPKPAERDEIPAKYRTADKSELKVTVKSGDTTFDVDMKK